MWVICSGAPSILKFKGKVVKTGHPSADPVAEVDAIPVKKLTSGT
jgi:hypothetical protein